MASDLNGEWKLDRQDNIEEYMSAQSKYDRSYFIFLKKRKKKDIKICQIYSVLSRSHFFMATEINTSSFSRKRHCLRTDHDHMQFKWSLP